MAYKISDECISCGACEAECPVNAISAGDTKYVIDPEKCTECASCQKICKLDIPVWQNPNSMDCIRCGDCKTVCPNKAIKFTVSNVEK